MKRTAKIFTMILLVMTLIAFSTSVFAAGGTTIVTFIYNAVR